MSFHASIVALKDFSPEQVAQLFPGWRVSDESTDFSSAIRYDFGPGFALGSNSQWTLLVGRDHDNVSEFTARRLLQRTDGGWFFLCGVASTYALLVVSDGVPVRRWFRSESSIEAFGCDPQPLGFPEDFIFSQLDELTGLSLLDLDDFPLRRVESTN